MEYKLPDYAGMITDSVRMTAFMRALEQTVTSHCVVLDIGCGTGIFSLLACRLGARRVFAVEKDDIIDVARQIAAANGYADRIEFFQTQSTNLELPEHADVVVSDLRGALPFYKAHVPSIIDARTRLLAPDGVLIPRRDILMAGVAQAPEIYRKWVACWDDLLGFDMRAARVIASNMWFKERCERDRLLSKPEVLGVLDYRTIDSTSFSSEVEWALLGAGTAHGVLVWFDTELADGVSYSSGPGEPIELYGVAFFPFEAPVAVEAGDRLSFRIAAGLVEEDYAWRWDTFVNGPASGDEKARFSQSTALGMPLPRRLLARSSATHVPELGDDGRIVQSALQLMDARHSLSEIAEQLQSRFVDHFPTVDDALRRVTRLALEYGR